MKYLIIYAHPNPKSFCAAVRDTHIAALAQAGNETELLDLYAENFKAALDSADFSAFAANTLPDDIKTAQAKIARADMITLIYPIWWMSFPAILKGFIDRVFLKGFAYDYTPQGPRGLLSGKQIIIFNTAGGSKNEYEKSGNRTCIEHLASDGIFRFSGLRVTRHVFLYEVPFVADRDRREMLESVRDFTLKLNPAAKPGV
ncbi:MAG: NAD(P)H-dependent oxidoreductase [Elusimicrobiaceae bacterium]|nr:NAD(P)H-dependent oxidoreductase [Elusimicrobiaceae bacterium]